MHPNTPPNDVPVPPDDHVPFDQGLPPAPRNPWEPTPYAAGAAQTVPAAEARPNGHAFRNAFGLGLLIYVIIAIGLHLTVGLTSYGHGSLMASTFLMPALFTALIARWRRRQWTWSRYLAVQVGVALLLAFLVTAGKPTAFTQVSAGPADQMKRDSRALNAGIFTPAESDCQVDRLMQHPNLTFGQIDDYFPAPKPGIVQTAYAQAVMSCIDQNAVVEAAPVHPVMRQRFINGVLSAAPDLTQVEAGCILDGILARGVTPRQATLAGYDEALQEQILPELEEAFEVCLPPVITG